MMIVDQLVVQHQTLRNKASEAPDAVDMNEVLALMDQVQAASAHVENSKQREQLQAILFHWNGYVHTKTGAYPGTQLANYSPVPTAENTGRVTTTKPELALPKVHWAVWAIAILLFVGGALVVILPRISGANAAEADPLPEVTQTTDPALSSLQTVQATDAKATAILEMQATAAAEALQLSEPAVEVSLTQPAVASGPYSYMVASGDTLFGIARRFNTNVTDIMVMNGLASQSLSVGQTLVLPNPPLTPEANTNPDATAVSSQTNNEQIIELVIRANTTPLRSGPGADFSEITTLTRGTFVYAVGRNQPASWYLVQLEDGVTRGWLAATDASVLHPVVPESIPVITTP